MTIFWDREVCSRQIANYLGARMGDVEVADKTANGETDDKREDEAKQVVQIMSGTTDMRDLANSLFTSAVSFPALTVVGQDLYDMSQGFTRLNTIYLTTRGDYYAQAEKDKDKKLNRLKYKCAVLSAFITPAQAPLKDFTK